MSRTPGAALKSPTVVISWTRGPMPTPALDTNSSTIPRSTTCPWAHWPDTPTKNGPPVTQDRAKNANGPGPEPGYMAFPVVGYSIRPSTVSTCSGKPSESNSKISYVAMDTSLDSFHSIGPETPL